MTQIGGLLVLSAGADGRPVLFVEHPGVGIMAHLVYELSFKGAASATLQANFDDCEITTGRGTTTLRVVVPDAAAMHGMVDRVTGLGLEILQLRLVAEPEGAGPEI